MNFNTSTIIVSVVIILAVPYLIIVLKRSSQKFPFIKALNPFYTKEMLEADELKKSISPILDEIETQRVAKFIKHWSDKFANDRLTVEDVQSLNARIAEGAAEQVNGILAIHPEGRKMFDLINNSLIAKEELVLEEAAV